MPITLGNKTTTGENPAAPLTGAELVRGVQSGSNVKMTTAAIAALGYASPSTSDGDLIVHSGGADQRLPIGASGLQLVVDPAQPLKVKWYDAIGALAAQYAANSGATLLGFIQSFAGAIARTQALKNSDTVSILEFSGVDPSGTLDSKAGLQAAFAACDSNGDRRILLWRKGTYKITGQLSIGSNVTVIFEPGVVINYTGDVNTVMFAASNQICVYFLCNGAVFNGNRAGVTLSDSGNQTCFYVYGSDNVLIQDANIMGFAYDGITLTGDASSSGPCTNVRLVGNDVYNCGRNALSIIHADTVRVEGGRYWGSNGTPSGPWAGVDVEPNTGEYAKNIVLVGVKTQSNYGAGLEFVPGGMSTATGGIFDVTVIGGRSINDGLASSGSTGIAALHFTNGGAQANEVGGQITVRDYVIEGPNAMGVYFKNWDALNSPRVTLDNVIVYNPNANAASTGNLNRSGFVIFRDSGQLVNALGKITLRGCKAVDNRASPTMIWGGYIAAVAGKTAQDVTVLDFASQGATATGKYPFNTDLSGGALVDVVVSYTNPKPVSLSASVTDAGYGGQRINLTTAATSFTLPPAANCKGLYYEVQCDPAAAGNCTVIVSGSDHIKSAGVAAATSLTLQPGDCIRFRSEGGTLWSAAAVA